MEPGTFPERMQGNDGGHWTLEERGDLNFRALMVNCGRSPQGTRAEEGLARRGTIVHRMTEMEATAATALCSPLQLGL